MIAVHLVPVHKAEEPAPPEFQLLAPEATRFGTYAPGARVRLLSTHGEAVCVCLDPAGEHPNGHCHVATIPRRHVGLPERRSAA